MAVTSKLNVEFVLGGVPQSMQGKFTNTGATDIEVQAFTTFTVNSKDYYNSAKVLVPVGGGQVVVSLSEGSSAKHGSNVTLSTLSVDYNSGKTQLKALLGASSAPWQAVLPTETGDTILSLISTVHASAQQNILRSLQDAFPATAVSDSAIYAGATMQGIRLNRKLPANILVSMVNNSAEQITLPPYTMFSGANTYWFNRDFITLNPGVPVNNYSLFQGVVKVMATSGLGTPYQAWASPENSFSVSDTDTYVYINTQAVPKLTTGLWSSKVGTGFIDKTLPTGEFVVEFGDGTYGSSPGVSDNVVVLYVVTSGAAANSVNAQNKSITTSQYSEIKVVATQNPSGGADQTSALRYKNIAAYSFGTLGSAVNKSQLLTTILEYPGIADAATFSEREIYQSDPRLMNYVQVTYLLKAGIVWNSTATTDFINYLQDNSSYSCRFNIVPPSPNRVPVKASIYCKSWANLDLAKSAATQAIRNMFGSAGLNYDIMLTDITTAILNSYAGVDYVDLISPVKDAIVSTPWIPAPHVEVDGGGSLPAGAVAYAVGYTTYGNGVVLGKNIAYVVVPNSGSVAKISWAPVASAAYYTIYGRGGAGSTWGVIASNILQNTYMDVGLNTPAEVVSSSTDLPFNVVQYNELDQAKFSLTAYYSQRSGASSSQG